MDATLIVIDSDAELARARALLDRLMILPMLRGCKPRCTSSRHTRRENGRVGRRVPPL
jgi:hypothetical protein